MVAICVPGRTRTYSVADVVVAVGHRAVAPGIGYAGNRGRMADARLVIDVVGAPERCKLAKEVGALVGELGGAQPVHRVRSRLLPDCCKLVADLLDRLLPAHLRPLAVDELHRIFEPPVAVHELAHRGALGAVRAAVDGRIPARLLADPNPVCDLGRDRASDRAVRADVLADDDLGSCRRRRSGMGLAHGGERQRAERGKTAAEEARAAQQRAPINPAIRFPLHCGEGAAGAVTLRSPDQHDRLLSPDSG